MLSIIQQFAVESQETAHAAEAAGGISALGINLQAFLFQLITFVIVLLVLRKFVFGKLVDTLDARRKAVEKSLNDAEAAEAALKETNDQAAKLIKQARAEADDVIAVSQKEAAALLEDAEAKAAERAEHIVKEAKAQMNVELAEARKALQQETARLVAQATEKIIRQKLDPAKDKQLIEAALREAEGRANG